MPRKSIFSLIALLTIVTLTNAQSNIRTFTPSATIKEGSVQVKWFNSLFTQTSRRGENREKISVNGRQAFFTSTIQSLYGVSNKVNVGFDIVYSRSKFDNTETSPFSIFGTGSESSKSRLSYVGPSIKIAPLNSVPRLSYQGTLWLPLGDNLESGPDGFVADDYYIWYNRFFYDRELTDDFLIFFEADLNYRIARKSNNFDFFRVPLSVFLSYFPQDKLTFYVFSQYSPRFEKIPDRTNIYYSQNYLQLGIGSKYQLTSTWEIELSYGNFVSSRNDGAADIINLGLRYLY